MNRIVVTRDMAHDLRAVSWLVGLIGLMSVAAGAILVARPGQSLKALAVVMGIFLLLDGIAELVSSVGDPENRTAGVILGVLGVIIGIVLIRQPFHGVNAVGLLIGVWLIAAGGIRLVRAIVQGVRPVIHSLIALLEVAVGVAIVSDPHIGYTALALIAGIWLIANGIGMLALAIASRA